MKLVILVKLVAVHNNLYLKIVDPFVVYSMMFFVVMYIERVNLVGRNVSTIKQHTGTVLDKDKVVGL